MQRRPNVLNVGIFTTHSMQYIPEVLKGVAETYPLRRTQRFGPNNLKQAPLSATFTLPDVAASRTP